MSKLNICTSETRPQNPLQGDMLLETDTNLLILYYNGTWLTFGGSGSASSTVLNIDITLADSDDLITLVSEANAGEWFFNSDAHVRQLTIVGGDHIGDFTFESLYRNKLLEYYTPVFQNNRITTGITDVVPVDGSHQDIISQANLTLSTTTNHLYSYSPSFMNGTYVFHHVPEPSVSPSYSSVANIRYRYDTLQTAMNTTYQPGDFVITSDPSRTIFAISDGDALDNAIMLEQPTYLNTHHMSWNYGADTTTSTTSGFYGYHGMFSNWTQDHTTTCWFKLSADSNNVSRGVHGYSESYVGVKAVSAADGSGWYIASNNSTGINTTPAVGSPGLLQADQWYNVTITNSSQYVRLYLDGVLIGGAESTRTNHYSYFLGNITSNNHNTCLDGQATSLASWTYALPESTIQDLATTTDYTKYNPYRWYHPGLRILNNKHGVYNYTDTSNLNYIMYDPTDNTQYSSYYRTYHDMIFENWSYVSTDHPTV